MVVQIWMKLDENASCSFMISHHISPPSDILCKQDCIRFYNSVTRLKSPNVYKSCPKMISLEKRLILTPLQKLLKNVRDLGKLIVADGFKSRHSPINPIIWSHCPLATWNRNGSRALRLSKTTYRQTDCVWLWTYLTIDGSAHKFLEQLGPEPNPP